MKINIATLITVSRIAIAPIFAYEFIRGYGNIPGTCWVYNCIALAVLIEVSDLIDGIIARARKEVTDFGKIFDPVADSVARQTIFISFMVTGIIPFWMYLLFFYRDAFMQLLRVVCASSGVVLAARKSGKLKAVLQGIATFGVLAVVFAHESGAEWMPQTLWGRHPGFWIMAVTATYTVLSVIDYIIPNRALIAKMVARKE